ncbi:hypothetical protein RvY_14088 [Ramazzottius varieornatus]|uniref:Structural maintenance of chromosomes protein 5 n=1 Tax=Ramazzottius varieornatus TaxID=947166 RepID=A0A1D1VV83_RAMVA|nr:hypothetical protein RvY_14088 [Ramazzottius varieornatus]
MEEGNGTLPMEADDDVDTKGDIKLFIHSSPVFKKGAIKRLAIRNFLTFGETQPGPSSRKAPAPLYFYFEPSINIISGPNGFGKSSIVNAIALCCGSRAKFLRRGNVYGDLVKRGAGIDRAEIELTLHNPDHPKGQTRFARTIYRQSKNERTPNNEFFINGKPKKFHEYRARLKEEFRIVPENLSLFLLQDRIADLFDLKPFELLKCAEQSVPAPPPSLRRGFAA